MGIPVKLYETKTLRNVTGPAIRPGGMALTERAVAYCRLPQGATVLDVGCGSGATVKYLRQRKQLRAFGLDLSWNLLSEEDDPLFRSVRVQGKADAIPFGRESVAALFCECVLSLLSDPLKALNEWRRVLVPGGYLIVSDLYTRVIRGIEEKSSLPLHCCLDGAVSREVIFSRIRAAGFDLLRFEDHTDLLTQLAAQLVWRHGSLAAFWKAVGGNECLPVFSGSTGRPGYYLLVARKGEN